MARVAGILGTVAITAIAACSFEGSATPPAGSDAGADAAPAADAAVELDDCGGPAVYVDGFEGPDLASHWNVFLSNNVTADGALTVNPNSTSNPSGLTSGQLVDLSGDRITLEVVTHFTTGSGRQASFVLARAANRFFGFHMSGDELTVELAEVDISPVFMTTPLDRAAHRHLSLREQDGMIVWEASADGVTWDMLASAARPDYVSAVRVQILAIDGSGSNDPIVFDNLNGDRDQEPWCDASSFRDPFDDGILDARWFSLQGDNLCAGNVERTDLKISTIAGQGLFDTCGLRSAPAYRLTENSVTLDVAPITDDEVERYFSVVAENEAYFGLSHSAAGMCSYSVDDSGQADGAFANCITYDTRYRFWRIRNVGTDVILEVSTDQQTWVNIATRVQPFPLDTVDVSFGISIVGSQTIGSQMTVRGYNAD